MTDTHNRQRTFRVFQNAQEARDFRHAVGTGGWIFEEQVTGTSTLFPPDFTPSAILVHPLTKGQCGRLIGAA